jgi:antitoxin MazE
MRVRIVRIGNSRGVRIPKAVLDETGLHGEVELRVVGRSVLLEAIPDPRADWVEAFAAGGEADGLADGDRSPTADLEHGPWG